MDNPKSKLLVIIGLNILKLRTKLELSQAQLGFEAGLTREFINKIENGKENISVLNLEQIANVLNVPPDQLMRED